MYYTKKATHDEWFIFFYKSAPLNILIKSIKIPVAPRHFFVIPAPSLAAGILVAICFTYLDICGE